MSVVFVNKEDRFDFIEVEMLDEPVPDPDPATFTTGGRPGRFLDVRYRKMGDQKTIAWQETTLGVLKRNYTPHTGRDAKELVSPSGESLASPPEPVYQPEPEPEVALLSEEEAPPLEEEEPAPKEEPKPRSFFRTCDQCGKKYLTESGLDKHVAKKHPEPEGGAVSSEEDEDPSLEEEEK